LSHCIFATPAYVELDDYFVKLFHLRCRALLRPREERLEDGFAKQAHSMTNDDMTLSIVDARPLPGGQSITPSAREIGLALSGGGVRAAVFHLGALKRLAGEDLLEQVSTISTVSGGSLIMAALPTSLWVVIFAAVC
jgi:hypothetical protein